MTSRSWWLLLLVGLMACEPVRVSPADAGMPDAGPTVGRVEGVARLDGAVSHEGITLSLRGTELRTSTDAKGGFLLEAVPEGAQELVASKEGFVTERRQLEVKAGESLVLSLSLTRAVGGIAGRVSLGGAKSHEGVTVSLEGSDLETTTLEDGAFLFEGVPTGAYVLWVRKAGYVAERRPVEVTEDRLLPVELTLERVPARVTGRVSLTGASSHEGVSLSLEGTALRTTTTGEGLFDLGAVPIGTHWLVASKEGYVSGRWSVEVKQGELVTLNLSLTREVGQVDLLAILEGVNARDGVVLRLEGTSFQITTNSTGYVRWDGVPSGTYVASAQKEGYVAQQQRAVVTHGGFTSLVFRLKPETGRVAGRVQLEGSASHEGVTVSVSGTQQRATTGADGLFELGEVPIGTRVLSAQKAGYVTAQTSVTVKAGETLTPSLSLTKAIGRVAGRISLSDVSTHEGITVSLEGSTLSTTTTVTGDFSLEGVPAGAYVLSAQKGRYTKARQNVNVRHGQTTSASLSLTKLPLPTLPPFLLAVQGGRLTLRGSEFGALRGGSWVSVDGVVLEEYVLWSDSQVVVQLPDTLSPGTRDVVLFLEGWGSSSLELRVLPQVTLAGGPQWLVGIREDNTVVAFGSNTSVPPGLTDVVSVAGGAYHALALKRDGTVVAWGKINDYQDYGQATVPEGLSDVVFVTAGNSHSLALRQDGTFVGWGYSGVSTPMESVTDVVGISAGAMHSLVFKRDGGAFGWGYNLNGEASIPGGLTGAVGVAAGSNFSLVLKQDGTVVAWGRGPRGETTVPPGLTGVVAVAAGWSTSAALQQDGTLVAWGASPGELSGVAAVVGAGYGVMALTREGAIVWATAATPAGLVLKVPAP